MGPGPPVRRDALLLVGAAGLAYALVLGLAGGGVAVPAAVLPALLSIPATVVLWRRIGHGDRSGALRLMAAWAGGLIVVGTLAMSAAPDAAAEVVAFGPGYRDGMMHWVRTGEGAEGDLGAFLPVHLGRLGLFLPLALVSGGALGLAMGAVMVNYMNLFVASYAAAAGGGAGLLAWFPWALCRVAAFTILGVLLAEPLIRYLAKRRGRPALSAPASRIRLLVWAGALLGLDVLLKAAVAPAWGAHLARLLP